MSFWRRNSSMDPGLPRFSNETAAQPEQQQTVDNIIPNDNNTEKRPNSTETRNPNRTWSSISRVLRIDTSFTRHGTSGLVMSPEGSLHEEPEVADGTFSQMILKEQKEKEKEKPMLTGKTMVEEEKPGSGHVWDIYATLPKHIRRWHKPAPIPVAHTPIFPGSLPMNRKMEPLPNGWKMHIHPEGKPYYQREAMEPEANLLQGTLLYDKGKALCRPLPMVTDSDPRDPIVRKTLEHAHFMARITVAENEFELPERCELFIELYPEDEEDLRPYAGYYLVDHDNQVVFWAAQTTTNDVGCLRVNPETFADQHLRLQLTAQYWFHVECYPIEENIDTKAAHEYLTDQLAFMYIDVATSASSTSTWTENQCQSFLSMLNHCPPRRKTWAVARLTALMVDWQFQNLYGHPAARLDRCHSYEVEVPNITPEDKANAEKDGADMKSILTTESDPPMTLTQRLGMFYQFVLAVLLRITCVLLFDAPATHYHALEKVWVDKIVHKVRFQFLIDRTVKDWSDVSLLSTVLWTANMAFLAIPFPILDPQQQDPQSRIQEVMRIAMITASLASTVFSVGSIAISLLHIRKHRTDRTAEEYCQYLETQHHDVFGHRPLAIIWALPFAFLMWSVLTFSTAVMLFTIMAAGEVTKYLLVALSAFIVAWIVLCVWYFWKRESHSEDGLRPRFKMIFTNWTWDWRASPSQAVKQVLRKSTLPPAI